MAEGAEGSGLPNFSGRRQNRCLGMGAIDSTSHNRCSDKFGNSELEPLAEECGLCHRPAVLEQDHDHRTDLLRGRVCHSCNLLIGRFDRPLSEIQRFLEYLTFWAERHATVGGQTYTAWMRERLPGWKHRRKDLPKIQSEVA